MVPTLDKCLRNMSKTVAIDTKHKEHTALSAFLSATACMHHTATPAVCGTMLHGWYLRDIV